MKRGENLEAPKWVNPTLRLVPYQSPSQYSLGVLANTGPQAVDDPLAHGGRGLNSLVTAGLALSALQLSSDLARKPHTPGGGHKA
jgi:hypothetical protein